MKNVESKNIKRLCNFYVNEVHLSVMLFPYINKEMNEDVEITTIFEKINKAEFEDLINKINFPNKNKLLNLNWSNNNEIANQTKKILKNNKKNTIIISGSKEYILNKNEEINEVINKIGISGRDIKIINCFQVEDVIHEMPELVEQHNGILNTQAIN